MAAPGPQTIIELPLSMSAVAFLDQLAQVHGCSRELLVEEAVGRFIAELLPRLESTTYTAHESKLNSRTGHAAEFPPKPD